jgi:hypothetical protein
MKSELFQYKDGKKTYPVREAVMPFPVPLYREDDKKAVVGDPKKCRIALGACHLRGVLGANIGSAKDAYIVMKTSEGPIAFHYVIPAATERARDAFDTDKKITETIVMLNPPTAGRTLTARRKLNKRRRAEIKAGARVKKRGKRNRTRIMRLGVPRRPAAEIVGNTVSVPAGRPN